MPPAMRASAYTRSDPMSELTRRRDFKFAIRNPKFAIRNSVVSGLPAAHPLPIARLLAAHTFLARLSRTHVAPAAAVAARLFIVTRIAVIGIFLPLFLLCLVFLICHGHCLLLL